MLKPSGVHIFSIPFCSSGYEECLIDIGDEQRKIRFGQLDHLRRFGKNDIQKYLGKIVNIPNEFDATKYFREEDLIEYNIPKSVWHGFTGSSVLRLKKSDYRLIAPEGR